MQIQLNPFDTLFFRDGKPFEMGEESWADGIFPPLPSVFMGLLRTAYLSTGACSPQDVLNQTQGLHIKQVLLGHNDQLLFPTPLDLIHKQNEQDCAGAIISYQQDLIPNPPALSSNQAPYLLIPRKEEEESDEINPKKPPLFFLENDFNDYLKGEDKIEHPIHINDYFKHQEPKIGIARDRSTHIVQESALYRVNMQRLEHKTNYHEKISILVDFDGINLPDRGTSRFGAEGKTVAFSKVEKEVALPTPEITGNKIKLYFATPGIFAGGWHPFATDPLVNSQTTLSGTSVRFLAAASDKPIACGGFDMVKRIPKPMYRAIPAGSVFYLELETTEQAQTFAKQIHGTCLSDYGKDSEGFGLCLVGNVQSQKIKSNV